MLVHFRLASQLKTGNHLYSWVEDASMVRCLAEGHLESKTVLMNIMDAPLKILVHPAHFEKIKP
jgi:hypothetical protein